MSTRLRVPVCGGQSLRVVERAWAHAGVCVCAPGAEGSVAGAGLGVRARVCAPHDRWVSKWGGIRASLMAGKGVRVRMCVRVCAASLFVETFPERLL